MTFDWRGSVVITGTEHDYIRVSNNYAFRARDGHEHWSNERERRGEAVVVRKAKKRETTSSDIHGRRSSDVYVGVRGAKFHYHATGMSVFFHYRRFLLLFCVY